MSVPHEGNRDYVNMEAINRLALRWKGSATRTCYPDRLYPLPPVGRIDRYSRCFVTQESHIVKRNQSFCVACDHWLTEN